MNLTRRTTRVATAAFDFEAGKARVRQELSQMVERIWPEVARSYQDKVHDEESRIIHIFTHESAIADEQVRWLFLMLAELAQDCFWHAIDHWPDLSPKLSAEERQFYAQMMIGQARRSSQDYQGGAPRGKLGWHWLVCVYDNGTLKEYISPELLAEAVNRGFWEFANEYLTLTSRGGLVISWEWYDVVMKYRHLLDFSLFRQFGVGPKPLTGKRRWVDERYLECFERAREKLSLDEAAYFVRPILDQIIEKTLFPEGPDDEEVYEEISHAEENLASRLAKYQEFWPCPIIQELFRECVTSAVELCVYGDVSDHDYITAIQILIKYLQLEPVAIQDLISSHLPPHTHGQPEALVGIGFEHQWLNAETQAAMRVRLIERFAQPVSSWEGFRPLIPHLRLMQEAAKAGWMEEELVRGLVVTGVEKYLRGKRLPGIKALLDLVHSLDRELIGPELTARFEARCLADIAKRDPTKASELKLGLAIFRS